MSNVKITLSEYERLTKRDMQLQHLEICGVDNWSGYGQFDEITGEDSRTQIDAMVNLCKEKIIHE